MENSNPIFGNGNGNENSIPIFGNGNESEKFHSRLSGRELEAGIPGNSRDREFPLMVVTRGYTLYQYIMEKKPINATNANYLLSGRQGRVGVG